MHSIKPVLLAVKNQYRTGMITRHNRITSVFDPVDQICRIPEKSTELVLQGRD